MPRAADDQHRTTIYLSRQHEDLLDYIILMLKRNHNVRVTRSDVIRKGIETIARMNDDERMDVFG